MNDRYYSCDDTYWPWTMGTAGPSKKTIKLLNKTAKAMGVAMRKKMEGMGMTGKWEHKKYGRTITEKI